MNSNNSVKILFVGFLVFSFFYLVLPNNTDAQEGQSASGCCQFFVDEAPGCLYPSSPDACAGNLNGKFLEGEKCDIDTGYCSGYEKGESKSSESNK